MSYDPLKPELSPYEQTERHEKAVEVVAKTLHDIFHGNNLEKRDKGPSLGIVFRARQIVAALEKEGLL